MNKPFFITTAIDYVNADPHAGHATEKVITDVVARYHRLLGDDTYFLTGSDENSLKNVQAAEKAGVPTEALVDQYAQAFQNLSQSLNLSFDQFIRTTNKKHFAGAQKMWSAFNREDIYKKKYSGLYCVGCEEFKTEKDLVDGKCPDHLKEPEAVEEENWFFKLSNYQDKLLTLIENDTLKIYPDYRKNEVVSFIKMGLEDFSISRSVARAKNWGVPVPSDATQIMYVWVDALSNYITALDYAEDGTLYHTYWANESERVHIIGKGILRFHAIYWPAMLLSANLPLPTTIYAHEYLTINGQKLSKSLGNVIHPDELVEKFGIDGTRYLLLTALPYNKDGDLSWEKMTEKYNADLANGLGNLVSRVLKLSEKLSPEYVVPVTSDRVLSDEVKNLLDEYRLSEALQSLWKNVAIANRYIDETKPWELAKTDQKQFDTVIGKLLVDIGDIAFSLTPFLPETAEKIQIALQERKTVPLFERIK
ncbi:MAG: methionine--tRNA ligase [Candidatus Moranbacteria bacterium]|nr:methionine--tRNA ligase [Candidatus Moranbacteria bacterium]MDD3964499.1 methionine--tRNA ligase [Candidatus Moranbacteria bacterium]